MIALPEDPQELQDLIDSAAGALCLESARQYGLVTGGPEVNVERCDEILRCARERGYEPGENAAERFVLGLIAKKS